MANRKAIGKGEKIEAQMAPMIDVVFQLLIFFMLTLKIIKEEGDFQINMPVSGAAAASDDAPLDIKIYMQANADGTLAAVNLGERRFPAGPQVFDRLNREIIRLVPGQAYADDVIVTIESDYGLHYDNLVQAVSAATGKVDERTGQPVRYVEKINLGQVRNAPAG